MPKINNTNTKDRKNKNKKAYLSNFHKKWDGSYEYRGVIYSCEDKKQGKKIAVINALLCAVSFSLLMIAGSIDCPGAQKAPYVVIPYVISVIAQIYLCLPVVEFLMTGTALYEHRFLKTISHTGLRCLICIVSNIITVANETIYLLINGGNHHLLQNTLFLCCLFFSACSSYIIKRLFKGLIWNADAQKHS